MKKFRVDGVEYNKEQVGELRELAIELRDESLKAGVMGWAVSLSHIIVVLGKVVEEIEE